jgi:hypothetical protein
MTAASRIKVVFGAALCAAPNTPNSFIHKILSLRVPSSPHPLLPDPVEEGFGQSLLCSSINLRQLLPCNLPFQESQALCYAHLPG